MLRRGSGLVSAQPCEGDAQGHFAHHSHSPWSRFVLQLPPPITTLLCPEPLLSSFTSPHGLGSNFLSASLDMLTQGAPAAFCHLIPPRRDTACVLGVHGATQSLPPCILLQALFPGLMFPYSTCSFPLLSPQPCSGGTLIKASVRAAPLLVSLPPCCAASQTFPAYGEVQG